MPKTQGFQLYFQLYWKLKKVLIRNLMSTHDQCYNKFSMIWHTSKQVQTLSCTSVKYTAQLKTHLHNSLNKNCLSVPHFFCTINFLKYSLESILEYPLPLSKTNTAYDRKMKLLNAQSQTQLYSNTFGFIQ